MELSILLASKAPYYTVIGISVIVILSYLFNVLSKKTNIPSVLMLIVLGVGIKILLQSLHLKTHQYDNYLEILGIVGLIMIVLEAALDLELTKQRWPIIWKSFMVALVSLIGSAALCAAVVYAFGVQDIYVALVYAVPLSIMSSAIIIPSVGGLSHDKKEFMVYESTFSDILGIMFFFFLTGSDGDDGAGVIVVNILLNITVTIVVAGVATYLLIYIFQRLTSHIKLFLLIGVLLLLYATGKLLGLSSLVIILIFGLALNNREVFFRGKLSRWLDHKRIEEIEHDFRIVTLESAFVVRTFFFVIFGMSIDFDTLADPMVAVQAVAIVAALYLIRWVTLKIFVKKDLLPQLFIAPRGLITILLFFSIPASMMKEFPFDSGILLYCIIITSVIMTISLIRDGLRLEHVDANYNQELEEKAGKQLSYGGLIPRDDASSEYGVPTGQAAAAEAQQQAYESHSPPETEPPAEENVGQEPEDELPENENGASEDAPGNHSADEDDKPSEGTNGDQPTSEDESLS